MNELKEEIEPKEENELNNDILEDIDTSWITEFENLDNEYKDYYTEDISFVKIHYIYVNKANEIEKVSEQKLLLKVQSVISKEEIIGLIKHNMVCDNRKYSLLYILKYNINIEPFHLKTFIRSKKTLSNIGNKFLHSMKNIQTITFDKTISMFHDLNDLFIIFYEKESTLHNNQGTKKIYINSNSNKKTKRNLFKDNMI